jgi:glutathione synthase/RimK-type ligase-like ATP-grasp enzyme
MKDIKILWFEAPDNIPSGEHGRKIGEETGYHVDFVTVEDIDFSVSGNELNVTSRGIDLVRTYDAIIIRSCIPYISEAITIARLFKLAGKVVVDESMVDEAFAMSKMYDYIMLSRCNVNMPDTTHLFHLDQATDFVSNRKPPFIVKSIHGDFGRHVYLVHTMSEIAEVFSKYRSGKLMIQEFLTSDKLYKVMVVGYKSVPIIAIHCSTADDNLLVDRKYKYVTSGKASDYQSLISVAELCAKTLRIELCSVDIKVVGGIPFVLEANRRPGLLGFLEDTDYDASPDLLKYVSDKCNSKPNEPQPSNQMY